MQRKCRDVSVKHLNKGDKQNNISFLNSYSFTKSKRQINKAFTLVELIVVITILAILATIGFVSFSGYLAGTRDTNRKAQLKSMSDALELYRTKKDLPIPDDKVDVKVGTGSDEHVIAYQGYIGKNVLETIEYTESGLDPKDKQYFSYYLTKDKKYYQLMSFLEEENDDVVAMTSHPNPLLKGEGISTTFAGNYEDRQIFVQGKKLGILTDETNTPIQEIENIKGSGSLNIEYTTDTYKATLENLNSENGIIVGTGSTLKMLAATALVGGVKNSCKVMLQKNSKLKGKDGYYLINQESPTKVYCDMTTDGGGWTRYVNIKDEYSFDDAKQCWLAKSSWENTGKTIECFNPNRLNFVVSEYMVKQNTADDGTGEWKMWKKKFKENYPSQIENVQYENDWKCKGGKEYMVIMKDSTSYPKSDASDASRARLGLSFCDENTGYEIGGRAGGDNFINCSRTGFGPSCGGRESTVKPAQLFIR